MIKARIGTILKNKEIQDGEIFLIVTDVLSDYRFDAVILYCKPNINFTIGHKYWFYQYFSNWEVSSLEEINRSILNEMA